MNLDHLRGKSLYILGLSRSGTAAIKAFAQHGAILYAWDDSMVSRDQLHLHVPGVSLVPPHEINYDALDYLVISPGIPNLHPYPHPAAAQARAHDVPIVCDVELFAQGIMHSPVEIQPKIVGITGTNGKSTVTAMMTHILNHLGYKAYAGGNIGNAVFNLPDAQPNEFYILELSSYQLELVDTPFLSAALLINISEDHLDRHNGMEGYIAAKEHIFRLIKSGGKSFIGLDDPYTQKLHEKYRHMLHGFTGTSTPADGVHVDNDHLANPESGERLNLKQATLLKGAHNYQNIAACYSVINPLIHCSMEDFGKALKTFTGLPHRQQVVANKNGLLIINDSKATSNEAAAKSLSGFKNIYWIMGGVPKTNWQDLRPLQPHYENIKKVYTYGQSGQDYARVLSNDLTTKYFDTLKDATAAAFADATADGDESVILLAPACSSFDQFKDFEDRGLQFIHHIKELMGG